MPKHPLASLLSLLVNLETHVSTQHLRQTVQAWHWENIAEGDEFLSNVLKYIQVSGIGLLFLVAIDMA